MSKGTSSLVLACLLCWSCAEFNDFDEMDDINDWVAKATRFSDVIGSKLSTEIPYIIVAGDQGVGKSTTINRLVNDELFPMRTAEQASKDAPMTKVATLYQVTRNESGNPDMASVGTTCKGSVCKKKECEMQEVNKDKLAATVDRMQNTCFGGKFFGVNDIITVRYAKASVHDLAIVDLPGIQQAGADKTLSKDLTLKWLNDRPNSIILAVMRADNTFQADIFGMLEEKLDSYRGRVIFAVTKPQGIGEKNEKAVNMVKDVKMKKFDAPGLIVHSADTSNPDVDLSMDGQRQAEIDYFSNDDRYRHLPEIWGIDKLTKTTQTRYLQVACNSIPRLQGQLKEELTKVTSTLRALPAYDSLDTMLPFMLSNWQKKLRDEVYFGETASVLRKKYDTFRQDGNKVSLDTSAGLKEGSVIGLHCEDAFFRKWRDMATNLGKSVKSVMHTSARASLESAINEALNKNSPMTAQAWRILKAAGSCDDDDFAQTLKRIVCSHTWRTTNEVNKDLKVLRNHLSANVFPVVLTRIVVQVCVMEPIENLRFNVDQSKELKDALASSLDVHGLISQRADLKDKATMLNELLDKRFDCKKSG